MSPLPVPLSLSGTPLWQQALGTARGTMARCTHADKRYMEESFGASDECGNLEFGLRLDRALDLDSDSPLHGQREELSVVGGERRRRPRRAGA